MLFVLLAGFLAYGIALKADFYMDDYMHLVNSEEMSEGRWMDKTFREVPFLMWTAVLAAFGYSAPAFHALNLAAHLANTLLTIAATWAFFRRAGWFADDDERERAAVLAGLLFACHPLCSEAVFYARCFMDQLVVFFCLVTAWSIFRFAESPRRGFLLLALIAIAAASRSKQPGLFHAAGTAIVCSVMAFDWARLRRLSLRPVEWATAGVIGLSAVGLGWHGIQFWALKLWQQVTSDAFVAHTLTQGRVFWHYVWRMVAPVGLSSDHHVLESTSAGDMPAVLATVAALGLMALAVVLLFRARTRAVGALVCLILLHLGLRFLYVIPELMVEYRVYHSMPWVAAALSVPLTLVFRWRWKAGAYAVLGASTVLILLCIFRGAVWQDSTRLARDVLDRYPLNNRARNIVMFNQYLAGAYDEARSTFEEAIAAYNAAEAFNSQDAPTRRHRRYEPIRLQQNLVGALNLQGLTLAEVESTQVAIDFIDAAIRKVDDLKRSDQYEENDDRDLAELLMESRTLLENHGGEYEESKRGS